MDGVGGIGICEKMRGICGEKRSSHELFLVFSLVAVL